MLQEYIGLKHNYNNINCISLITNFYKKQLNIKIALPEYPKSRRWMCYFTTNEIDSWAFNNASKISLTNAQNFNILVFKAANNNRLIHFGMYIKPNKMLHVEEGNTSRIDVLSDYWLKHLYGVYKHNELV